MTSQLYLVSLACLESSFTSNGLCIPTPASASESTTHPGHPPFLNHRGLYMQAKLSEIRLRKVKCGQLESMKPVRHHVAQVSGLTRPQLACLLRVSAISCCLWNAAFISRHA